MSDVGRSAPTLDQRATSAGEFTGTAHMGVRPQYRFPAPPYGASSRTDWENVTDERLPRVSDVSGVASRISRLPPVARQERRVRSSRTFSIASHVRPTHPFAEQNKRVASDARTEKWTITERASSVALFDFDAISRRKTAIPDVSRLYANGGKVEKWRSSEIKERRQRESPRRRGGDQNN